MALPVIFAKLVETGGNLINNVICFASQDKSAEAINTLVEPEMEAYRVAIHQIESADDLSTEQKVELLKDVANEIGEKQNEANIKLNERQRDAAETALKIIAGVLSAGFTFIPDVANMIKSEDTPLIDSERGSASIPENIEETTVFIDNN